MVVSRSRFCTVALVAALAAGSALAAAPATEPPPKPVEAPHYGDVLFHFFQDRHFSAVTGLMVSQHFQRMPHHEDDAEVLRGGLLLSYGLHREAGQIFAQLIEKSTRPSVRDRAWFFLAKIRHQRGFFAEAEDALNRIQGTLPPDLEEERGLLRAQLMMAREDYAGATALLDAMVSREGASRYARFNLGVALIRSGDSKRGNAVLDELGRMTAPDEETRSLRDRTNVALGFAALKDEKPEAAREHLGRVRLKSMHANKALLGFGWAAASLKDPQAALAPWLELSERDASDSAVLEARIAVPYAYAELRAYGQALARYEEAISAFEKESKALDESIVAVREGRLLKGLLDTNPGEEMGWFWHITKLPEMPHAGHLAPLLAQHEFQEAFKNYRDLLFLARNLQGWADNLGVFGDMLDNRRKAFAERLPKVREQAGNIGLGALQQRRDGIAAEVAQAEQAADGVALADARQRALMARLQSVKETLAKLGNEPEHAAARERARLAEGALTWELAQLHPERIWQTQKAMKIIDAELAGAQRRDAALAQAQRDEPVRFDAFGNRITELTGRVQALMPRVASLTREQQEAVQELAVAELQRQKERLQVYTVQARFAVAQLYDRATQSKEGEHAARP